MSFDLDSIFSNMEKASMSDKGSFFGPGLYLCELQSLEYREGFKGRSFIAKFGIVESNNEEHPAGATRSWIVKLDRADTKDMAMGDIKSLIFALLGKAPRDVGSADKNPKAHAQAVALFKAQLKDEAKAAFKEAYGIDAPNLRGKRVKLEATATKSQKTGNDFTRHAWSPALAAAT